MLNNLFAVFGGVWSVLLAVGTFWLRRELRPYLKVEQRRRMAEWIARLADDITDELRARYPESAWLERLDDAVDRLIDAAGIEQSVAQRAIRAAAARKHAN